MRPSTLFFGVLSLATVGCASVGSTEYVMRKKSGDLDTDSSPKDEWVTEEVSSTSSSVSEEVFTPSSSSQEDSLPAGSGLRRVNDGRVILDGVPAIPDEVVEMVQRYQNIRSASIQDWTQDGQSMYIATRFAETRQFHRVDEPGAARQQLTYFPEPVGGARRRPSGSEILFSMDEGGGEFYQLFLMNPDTGAVQRLTDGQSRNTSATFSRDGGRIAYTSTARDGRSNDIWLMDPEHPETARLVLPAPDGTFWAVADWHPDGSLLLVNNYVSANDSRLHVLNLESGDLRLIAGGEDQPASWRGKFAPDGNHLIVVTDAESEFRQLGVLDLLDEELRILTSSIPWDISSFEISKDGSLAAFVSNENGISRLYVFSPTNYGMAAIDEIPQGTISGLRFNPNATHLALNLNSSKAPGDVYSLDLLKTPGSRLQRWTFSEVGGLDTNSFVEPELVEYETFDQEDGERRRIPAFVYRPQGGGPYPVLIYIHGGPEGQFRPRFNSGIQLWANELGIAVVAPNVRGSSGYGKSYLKLDNGRLREQSVQDIGALLDWIETQSDLDQSRVTVYGGSYGGYMVLASLVHYSHRLKMGIEAVGISNFVTFLENTQAYRRDLRRVEYGDERIPEMREFLESISPSHQADRIRVPLLVAQGNNDPRVPASEAEQIVRKVREAGGEVWYMNALDEGHGFRKKINADLYQQLVVLFLEEHLVGDAAGL